MRDFVALDFETANGKRSSICSVGAVVVKNGEIVDLFYSLVKPTPNYYAWFCQEVHGLGYLDTDDADFFLKYGKDCWKKYMPIFLTLRMVKYHLWRITRVLTKGVCVLFLPHMRLLIQNMNSATHSMPQDNISAIHWRTTNCIPSPLPAVMI